MNKKQHITTMVILILIIIAASFFVGTKYQQRKTFSNFREQMFGGNRQGQGIGQGMRQNAQNGDLNKNRGQVPGFRQNFGEIINIDEKTLTLKMADGSSKIVLLSDSTIINQSVTATKSDLKVGTKIMVNGDTNPDGSISSRNIEINPAFATITPTSKL